MNECRILSPLGMLGYGFPPESLARGLARRVDTSDVETAVTTG